MSVSCHLVVVQDDVAANFDFDEVPRTGDYVFVSLVADQAPRYFKVDRVAFSPTGFAPQNVELFVSPAS